MNQIRQPPPLPPEERAKRAPPPPESLVGALHDHVGEIVKPPSGWTEHVFENKFGARLEWEHENFSSICCFSDGGVDVDPHQDSYVSLSVIRAFCERAEEWLKAGATC